MSALALRKFGELDTSDREAVRVNLFASQDKIKHVAASHQGSAAAEDLKGARAASARAASGALVRVHGGTWSTGDKRSSEIERMCMLVQHNLSVQGPWMTAGT